MFTRSRVDGRRRLVGVGLAATAALAMVPVVRAAAGHLPRTPRRPVTDVYHGVRVSDDYRWLEDWSSPEVRAWSAAQNAYAREYLDHLPMRSAILRRVTQLTQTMAPAYLDLACRRGVCLALENRPPRQQPMLVRLASVDDTTGETVIVDPNAMDPKGGTEIDFYVPSPDGSKVAVSVSRVGSESGTVWVFDAASGRRLSDVVPLVNGGTAGGSVVWNADGTGFWRTRYPAPGERPPADLGFYQQVYFHRLGTPAESDRYVIGREFPKIAEIVLGSSEDGRFTLLDLLNGDGGEHAFFLGGPGGEFQQVTAFGDQVVQARVGEDALYLLSHKDAPNGKILKLPLAAPRLAQAETIVAEGAVAIEAFAPAGSRLYVVDIVGGPSAVRVFDLAGQPQGEVPLPPISGVRGLVHTSGDAVLVDRTSFTEPPGWYHYAPGAAGVTPTALLENSPADFSDVEVRRELAVSKDGTKVPVNILLRKGTPVDGSAPALLTGYGGYDISQGPSFQATTRVWLEQGGIWALANLRGGGEFGEAWHRAGMLTRKQNVFDDFAAAAQLLIDRRYTSPQGLAIEGGSNGGLLMGAELVQHPALFQAVVSHVGIYDMLRVELSPNGLFNTTEFGSVEDLQQFAALYAYSPYHHVEAGVRYPSVLFLTGQNDPRVDPMNSRKMTARLQASGTKNPVLLRTSSSTGHGIGSPLHERQEEAADVFAFLFDRLGVEYAPVAAPGP
ncbi:MAG TPA: prolyl oligopeptidase family serine peptidase [Vicinamibacteria bacterium]|nr:prolyl oligopeptidase family serine peptidase [Vicinamibacteria bacterium]